MASAFWTLEDGRGFSRRWSGMAYMLRLITGELKDIREAKDFYEYLNEYVFHEEEGDKFNGYGGFIRRNETIMFNFDLRSFAPQNRDFFWEASQIALTKLIAANDNLKEEVTFLFIVLLDMHKRNRQGEDPMKLNHWTIIAPDPREKLGPGW
jgi:hypothetical protein